jgi:hypothetical protein
LGWAGASVFICATATKGEGGFDLAEQVCGGRNFREVRLQQPAMSAQYWLISNRWER